MVDASKLLGVDIMTGHWEFTYGADRVRKSSTRISGRIEFVAQNVKTADFGDPVFKPYTIRELNGVPVAVIGQAFPYTPIANPRHWSPDWTFGIQDDELQKTVDARAKKGAQAVVLLSHNGMDVDLKLASRVTGIDAILGGHTHDACRSRSSSRTAAADAGHQRGLQRQVPRRCSNSTCAAAPSGLRYRLLPVFANLLEPDAEMAATSRRSARPTKRKLEEKLATTEGLLYRRGNFNGTFDQVILDALLAVKDAEIAFSPGFRWGTTHPAGRGDHHRARDGPDGDHLPAVHAQRHDRASQIKVILEDICDNLFNPDPYYQQGGDMVRVGGLRYTCDPTQKIGSRISNMR
jgi:S-sulfosulfanyl-L-cysteine sulfohydrolase